MRLATGGQIDRSRSLELTFDGRPLTAHPGDTLVSAVMAKLQLECLAAEREPHNLVSETDTEDRLLPKQVADVTNRIPHSLRITRAIGEEDSVGPEVQDFFGRR
jgi:hypothetical protein